MPFCIAMTTLLLKRIIGVVLVNLANTRPVDTAVVSKPTTASLTTTTLAATVAGAMEP